MRKSIVKIMSVVLMTLLFVSCSTSKDREQWTEDEAWAWQEKVGVIKGFNEPYQAYPGQTQLEILQKAKSLGFNSVRKWIGGNTSEEIIANLQKIIDDATQCGMTVSPVLPYAANKYHRARRDNDTTFMADIEAVIRPVLRHFANNEHIVFWDLWNEPRFEDNENTYAQMDVIEQMVYWAREENVQQPITSSIIWATINLDNQALKRTTEVAAMMDIHNFHSYDCALHFGKNIYETLEYIKSISDRPMVATEALTRVNGSGIARSFDAFSKYKVNFYIWGMFNNDRNWESRWDRSTYDPYEPMFHNILYSDGDAVDARELDIIREYRFAEPGEELYPGLEVTDRMSHERVWKWMVTGPIKGKNMSADANLAALPSEYNTIRIKVNYADWKKDENQFFARMENALAKAAQAGATVMPCLLTDDDANEPAEELGKYVGAVIYKYYSDARIKAWELYHHPGEKIQDTQLLSNLVTTVFRYARNEYANQPLTMTPVVDVQPFAPDFDPQKAMIHGRTAGWDRLQYSGGSTADLVYKIWSLSDVLSFSSKMSAPQTAWLMSICYKFGRPIFCTEWLAPTTADVDATLERFAMSHVFWFTSQSLPTNKVSQFEFLPINTQRQITEGM